MAGKKVEQEVKLDKNQANLLPHLQDTYRNAFRSGFLKKLNKSWFVNEFKEYFFILTNVGIIYFRKMTEIVPYGFIPILGATISKPYKNNYVNGNVVFDISFKEIEMRVKLVATSNIAAEEWYDAIKKVQNSATSYASDTKEKNAKKELLRHTV